MSVITVGDFCQLPPFTKSRNTPFIFERQYGLWRSLFKSQDDCSDHTCMQLHVTHDFASCISIPVCLVFHILGRFCVCSKMVPCCHLEIMCMACHCLCINDGMHAAAVKELTINHRQSSDISWSDHLNTLRPGSDEEGLDAIYDILKTRIDH